MLRRYPKARAELESRLPGWRDAATAIGDLGIGLDDAEYIGGVLWYGLTHRGGKATRRSRSASSPTGWSAGPPGTAETPRGPRPPSAPSWISTWLDGSRTGRAGPRGSDYSPRGPGGGPARIPHSGPASRPVPRMRTRSALRAPGTARVVMPDQLAPGRQAGRQEQAQHRSSGREGKSMRTLTARR
jgi:hypothetical protein